MAGAERNERSISARPFGSEQAVRTSNKGSEHTNRFITLPLAGAVLALLIPPKAAWAAEDFGIKLRMFHFSGAPVDDANGCAAGMQARWAFVGAAGAVVEVAEISFVRLPAKNDT